MGETGVSIGLLATALGLGLRHGVDWDHIAAITDLTGGRRSGRASMRAATAYAGGHALVVFVLGSVAIVAGDLIPAGLDAFMGRIVGVTLLLLGVYVLWGLVTQGRQFRLRSRWSLLFALVRRARRPQLVEIEHEHPHPHPTGAVAVRHRHVHRGVMPADPFEPLGPNSAVVVGMLHGVGAETPTQVLLFLAASRAGGVIAGEALLVVFVAGLVASNTAIAAASTFGFLNAARHFRVYAAVAVVTGLMSLVVGAVLVAGRDGLLPAFFAG